uniref:Uncharacterized protein n=1 Tax=Siphoviridae sp. ctCIv11 TaxID=2827806 RepID=A0A8S5S2I9_9CAUD|nr:MAG TPA: hypothetical protein [Siphoviridae sp. ctCIv11]DAH04958.1 MAG TPA: hypothetical protein [Bacteriophage sp.]DAI04325.1 MAG TPA: hypothetical protein [Caudoviricetes sp.]
MVSTPTNFKNKTNKWGFRPTLLNARKFIVHLISNGE